VNVRIEDRFVTSPLGIELTEVMFAHAAAAPRVTVHHSSVVEAVPFSLAT